MQWFLIGNGDVGLARRRLARRTLGAIASAAIGWSPASPVVAQAGGTYPAKPVRIVAGFPAGGPVDTLARAIGEKLGQAMGQPFVVENIAGATGMIGTDRVAKSAADGYTLLVGASTIPIHEIGRAHV